MISHKHKWAWVAINKTATTSLSSVLVRKSVPANKSQKHQTLLEIHDILTQQQFDEYFKFSFVRDPWDRIVSLYLYRTRRRRNRRIGFEDWLKKQHDIIQRGGGDKFTAPQTFWLKDNSGVINMNFIGKVENIDRDWSKVCRLMGIEYHKLPVLKKGRKNISKYRKYYTDTALLLHKKLYSEDIKFLDYEF
jgi:hypothetical protein